MEISVYDQILFGLSLNNHKIETSIERKIEFSYLNCDQFKIIINEHNNYSKWKRSGSGD